MRQLLPSLALGSFARLTQGRMLTSASIAWAAVQGRLPGGHRTAHCPTGPRFQPDDGVGHRRPRPARQTRRLRRIPPLNLLWQAFAHEVAFGDPYSI
jgi:hypothetical protein